MDKPLTAQDTLALCMNSVTRIRIYETSGSDSSGKVPRMLMDTSRAANPLFEWKVMTHNGKALVTLTDDHFWIKTDKWKMVKRELRGTTCIQDEYLDAGMEFYFRFTCYADSNGRYTHSERTCTMRMKDKVQQYGLLFREDFRYENGLLKEVLVTEYQPAPHNNKIARKSKLVFIYE
jgi:hypothetical protein